MTLKPGDTVRVVNPPAWLQSKTNIGPVVRIMSDWRYADRYIVELDCQEEIGHFDFEDEELELIVDKPAFNPGDPVRGYIEGVIENTATEMMRTDSGWLVPLNQMTDITVINPLPTAPGSVIEYEGRTFSLGIDQSKFLRWTDTYNASNFFWPDSLQNENWTLKYDARVKND